MNDKIFYPLAAIFAIVVIAFSLIWPQGMGKISPAPFGHAIELPDYFRAQHDKQLRQTKEAADKAQRASDTASRKAANASASSTDVASSTSAS